MADDKISILIGVEADAKEVDELTKAFSELSSTINKFKENSDKTSGGLGGLDSGMKSVDSSTSSLITGFGGLAKKAGILLLSIKALKKGFEFLKKGIGKAADYQESMHLFNTVFSKIGAEAGDAFNQALWGRLEKFQNRYLELGLDPDVMLEGQGIFAQMANSAGMTAEATLNMSEGLTALAADYSTARNVGIDESMRKFHSGITGQIKSLRMYGIEVSLTALQEEARRYGIQKTTAQMNQAEKMQLRFLAIMRQGTVGMGDMAITALAPANSFRILKTQIAEAGRALGSIFIPMIKAVMPWLIAMAQAVTRLFQTIAGLFGYKKPKIGAVDVAMPTGTSVGGGGADIPEIGGNLGKQNKQANKLKKTLKEIRKILLGFDELNILGEIPDETDPSGGLGGIGGAGGGGGIGGLGDPFDLTDFIAEANQKYQDMIDGLMEKFREKMPKLEMPDIDFTNLKNSFENLKNALAPAFDLIKEGAKFVLEELMKLNKFIIEDALPASIDFLAESINLLVAAIELVAPAVKWAWTERVVPELKMGANQSVKIINNLTDHMRIMAKDIQVTTSGISKTLEDYHAGNITGFEAVKKITIDIFELLFSQLLLAGARGLRDLIEPFTKLPGKLGEWAKSMHNKLNNYIDNTENALDQHGKQVVVSYDEMGNRTLVVIDENGKEQELRIKQLNEDQLRLAKTFGIDLESIGYDNNGRYLGVEQAKAKITTEQEANRRRKILESLKLEGGYWDNHGYNVKGKVKLSYEELERHMRSPFRNTESFFSKLARGVVSAFDGIGGKINRKFAGSFDIVTRGSRHVSVQAYADGGTPQTGQMFLAREAGAELVGNVGGKTRVMNNDMIVESVSRGVAQAVAGVMNTQSSGGTVVVNVDGRETFRRNLSEANRQSMINGKTVFNV